jgi:para-aminobenzoate synthetase component 1
VPSYKFEIKDLLALKSALLLHSEEYTYASLLDSNDYDKNVNSSYEYIAGFGAKSVFISTDWEKLKAVSQNNLWLFGYLSYDLKNSIETLKSENDDGLGFPDLCFFEPKYLVRIIDGFCEIEGANPQQFFSNLPFDSDSNKQVVNVDIVPKISKENYIEQVLQLMNHIQLGDIFEVNFCQEFFAKTVEINPVDMAISLTEESPMPFSAYLKIEDKYGICASPERFMKRTGNHVISQPIKGTIKRGRSVEEDEALQSALLEDVKEKAENVMIVDLVRNDFSRFADIGSVRVEELFGIHTFPQVHQMISTVGCDVQNKLSVDIIKDCFPMGSMTGAPKVRAMQLIEQYESTKRGLYSGAIGYITPEGNFDFNVVIRSVLYNKSNKYLSCMVGGAITAASDPEKEYDESLLKAKAIFEILTNNRLHAEDC